RSELSRSPRAAKSALGSIWLDADDLKRRRYPRAEIDALLADVARIGAATSDTALAEKALTQLEARGAAIASDLRKETGLARAKASPKVETVRALAGGFESLRPRDLTWNVYARILDAAEVP
ncbi:MAG TPA: hypothetical protein VGR00_06560, partial [Thermoanaerobaculia bacterium]|nr:hypothetical protein [Thermoanaerobaculia bacterium]